MISTCVFYGVKDDDGNFKLHSRVFGSINAALDFFYKLIDSGKYYTVNLVATVA